MDVRTVQKLGRCFSRRFSVYDLTKIFCLKSVANRRQMLSQLINQYYISIQTFYALARLYLYAAENRAADDAINRKGGLSCKIV